MTPLFVPHTIHTHPLTIHFRAHSASLERALSLCEHGNNDDPHLKWKSNQNGGNHNKWSFPPHHLQFTPFCIPNHPRRIPIQIRTKTETLIIPAQSAIPAIELPISSMWGFYWYPWHKDCVASRGSEFCLFGETTLERRDFMSIGQRDECDSPFSLRYA